MKNNILTTVAAAFLIICSSGANAEMQNLCSPTKDARSQLKKVHSELPVSIGMAATGSVIEVFASKEGAFTIIASLPNGMSCLLAVGEKWEMKNSLRNSTRFTPANW